MKISGRVDGLESLAARLARVTDGTRLAGAIAEAAEAVRDAAQANLDSGPVPARPQAGNGDAITVKHAADGLSATVGTVAAQGWHREFGSLDRPAAAWLEPALEAARPTILARMRSFFA